MPVQEIRSTPRDLLQRLAQTFDPANELWMWDGERFKYEVTGADLLRRYLYDPTLNIDGIWGGYTGPGRRSTCSGGCWASRSPWAVWGTAADRVTFSSPTEEREYLTTVQAELDGCQTKTEVIAVWKRHYLKIGHRTLGRLLIGRPIEEIVKERG